METGHECSHLLGCSAHDSDGDGDYDNALAMLVVMVMAVVTMLMTMIPQADLASAGVLAEVDGGLGRVCHRKRRPD